MSTKYLRLHYDNICIYEFPLLDQLLLELALHLANGKSGIHLYDTTYKPALDKIRDAYGLEEEIDILNTPHEKVSYRHLEAYVIRTFTGVFQGVLVDADEFTKVLAHKLRHKGFLKPCPCCKGTNAYLQEDESDDRSHIKVLCENEECNEIMRSVAWDVHSYDAINTWNNLNGHRIKKQ